MCVKKQLGRISVSHDMIHYPASVRDSPRETMETLYSVFKWSFGLRNQVIRHWQIYISTRATFMFNCRQFNATISATASKLAFPIITWISLKLVERRNSPEQNSDIPWPVFAALSRVMWVYSCLLRRLSLLQSSYYGIIFCFLFVSVCLCVPLCVCIPMRIARTTQGPF